MTDESEGAKTAEGTVTRTLRLSLAEDRALGKLVIQALSKNPQFTADWLVELMVVESIEALEARYPALREPFRFALPDREDYPYAWTLGSTAARRIRLSAATDLRIRQITFGQGHVSGNLFAELVRSGLKRADAALVS